MKNVLSALLVLAFATSALSCSCQEPEPLSNCDVDEVEAFALVKVLSVTPASCPNTEQGSITVLNNGATIAKVKIVTVYKDNTGMNLQKKDRVFVSTEALSSLCGFPMEAGVKYIMKLRTTDKSVAVDETNECPKISDAPLTTSLCAGNIVNPAKYQKRNLQEGCDAQSVFAAQY